MIEFLEREAEKLRAEARNRISTKEKLDVEKEVLRQEFLFMLGLDPLPQKIIIECSMCAHAGP